MRVVRSWLALLTISCGSPEPEPEGSAPGPSLTLAEACAQYEAAFADCAQGDSGSPPPGWCAERYDECTAEDLAIIVDRAECYVDDCTANCVIPAGNLTPECSGIPSTTNNTG